MAWIILLIAGALEIAWAAGLKKLGVNFSWALCGLTALAMIASLMALYSAMTKLPLGIAYPVWTGIGSVGSVLVGAIAFNQSVSITSVLGVTLLIAGMLVLSADTH